jgi:hypothetical protein
MYAVRCGIHLNTALPPAARCNQHSPFVDADAMMPIIIIIVELTTQHTSFHYPHPNQHHDVVWMLLS